MAYRIVKGTFHLFYVAERRVGPQPDGDSLWFKPDKPKSAGTSTHDESGRVGPAASPPQEV